MPNEIAPQPMELTPRPMELAPLPPRRQRPSNIRSENSHQPNMINNTFINQPFFNTIRLTPINIVYDPDLQEAIRLSLED